jgi:hypothetical protein
MNDLRVWCESQNTGPAMLELINKCLLAWRNGQDFLPYFERDLLATAYDDQRLIGWGCFLEGSMATAWLPIQADYLRSHDLRDQEKQPELGQRASFSNRRRWLLKCGNVEHGELSPTCRA